MRAERNGEPAWGLESLTARLLDECHMMPLATTSNYNHATDPTASMKPE